MEFIIAFVALFLGFAGGVYFAFRHQARINKDVADYKQAAKEVKDLADRLRK